MDEADGKDGVLVEKSVAEFNDDGKADDGSVLDSLAFETEDFIASTPKLKNRFVKGSGVFPGNSKYWARMATIADDAEDEELMSAMLPQLENGVASLDESENFSTPYDCSKGVCTICEMADMLNECVCYV